MTTTTADPVVVVRHMSIDRFLEELAGIRTAFLWEANYGTREQVRGFGNIRARCENVQHCPITAMVLAVYGETYLMAHYQSARVVLGLSEDDALLIAEAADAPLSHNTELLDLHNRLLDALGL